MTEFVRAILGCPKLYQYACPLGALNLSVMTAGDRLRWHFDQSDFVVSLAIAASEQGGCFEYVSHLRSTADEQYEAVAELLGGDRSGVNELNTPPGSLVLFEGRHTIHRVTEVLGDQPRLVALFGYAQSPDVQSSDYLRMIRYGRTS